ncbi:MAG: PAS domain S-box protein [Desulfobacteraceae bacterium]|nr:PAS domain S-box protein [Desulfobacteraceae bacterium]
MEQTSRIERPKILRILGIITLILVAGASWLALSTARYMKDILRDQFNEQQLVLAKTAAQRIESYINETLGDLSLLNSLPGIQYCDPESYETLLLSTLPVLNSNNIVAIRRVDREGNTILAASDQGIGIRRGAVRQDPGAYLAWAVEPLNRGRTMGTALHRKDPAKDRSPLVLDLITPTYEDASSAEHPQPSRAFAGYLKFTVNISNMLHEIMPVIRSGKTGYAWVLDASGNFIYHPEPAFIGDNAFDARSNRNPAISFAEIDKIQREEMLKGREGMASYISGWHREVVEPMQKLIAYAPVHIQGPNVNYIWSVAVVAPVREVESVIDAVYTRQFLLQALVVFIIGLGSLVVVLYELRWSTLLEHEVDVKTNDIRKYADDLERSETKYRSLVEGAEDLIFTLDANGIIKTANRHMARLFGFNPENLNGQSLYRFLPREQVYEQLRTVGEAFKSGKGSTVESRLDVAAGSFWFNIQYIPIEGEKSEQLALGIARDITERKNIENQLINTEKLASLGTMAAGVAHEINNPIGIMLGFCDLLIERMEPGTIEYNDLKTIERHGLHCKSIVERLLSFARISEETEESCDLNENVESIISVVGHNLDINNIKLVLSLEKNLPRVRGDSRGLQQVFLNLITNAVQAMHGKGVLTVVTRLSGNALGTAEVIVSDTGTGIRREFLRKIFDPFFTTKKVGEGTGLGLSVSYGIITKYGGTIECQSVNEEEAPGMSGTTFRIMLPPAPAEH